MELEGKSSAKESEAHSPRSQFSSTDWTALVMDQWFAYTTSKIDKKRKTGRRETAWSADRKKHF